MRGINEHLSIQEMEQLTGANAGTAAGVLEDAMRHLESCDECRFRMLGVDPPEKAPSGNMERTAKCPPEKIWLDLAADLLPQSEARPLLGHAVKCGYCGLLLKIAIEDLAMELTPEEEARVKTLESAKPEWQAQLVEKIRAAAPSPAETLSSDAPSVVEMPKGKAATAKTFAARVRWAWAAAAAVLVAAGSWGWLALRGPSVEQLLAQSCTEKRVIELRIPGAHYAEFKVNLGAGNSQLDLPTAWSDAQNIIKHRLDANPRDARWLNLKGRAELLEGKADSALETLRLARQAAPNSPEVLTDLATAYFERAREGSGDGSSDIREAYALLSKVLEMRPKDPVALFNRAIVEERLELYPEAIADWNLYLSIDSASDWAPNARSRRDKLVQKLKNQESGVSQIRQGPAAFLALAESHVPEYLERIEQQAEDYQDAALGEWLPGLFAGESAREGRSLAVRALDRLADILAERHSDPWFRDFLRRAGAPGFDAGAKLLGDAIVLSRDAETALSSAHKAVEAFKAAGNSPGRLRAQVEEVHLLRRLQRPADCVEEAKALEPGLARAGYLWMRTQVFIDEASCTLMQGKFDHADELLGTARQLAGAGAYRNLALRITGISASVKSNEGYINAAWAEDHAGLKRYWDDGYASPARAQQFYDDLSYLAESLEDWRSAVVFAGESARMLALTGERENEGMARRRLAGLAMRAGDLTLASRELERSRDLLKPSDSASAAEVAAYRLFTEISTAEIEILQGDLEGARKRLDAVAEQADPQTFTISNRFYQTYGALLFREQRGLEAESALLSSADIADKNRAQIADPVKRYSWSQENSQTYRLIAALEMRKGDYERALAAWEWYRAAELPAGSPDDPQTLRNFWSKEKLRDLLPSLSGQNVVVYAMLPDGLAVWTVTEHGVVGQVVEVDAGDLPQLSAGFTQMCGNAGSDLKELNDTGRRLFKILVAPVVGRLDPKKTLVIEPDDILGNLPFQALMIDDHHYLGDIYRIGWSTGLLNTSRLRPSVRIAPSSPALVVGSAAVRLGSHTQLAPIPYLSEAVEEIGAHFERPRKLSGHQATAVALDAALPDAMVTHLIGHAIPGVGSEGFLLYSGAAGDKSGTILWNASHAVMARLQRSQLVVLAACSTGKAQEDRRGGRAELLHSFLLAGVPHVVASRWDVDSVATSRLMNVFYERLLAGGSVAGAMQAAEASVRSGPGTRHPFYWAAFAAFGRA